MSKTLILFTGILIILLTSCQKETTKKIEIENPIEFKSGEWVSSKDSLSGISIRKELLVFYENNKFEGDDVDNYLVVDSIKMVGTRKSKIGTYLKRINLSDTLYSEIVKYSDSSLTLKKNNGIVIYKLK